ncbi:MAG: hypothetical protein KBA57_06490 [Sphingomonadaceae bacterium]|nr:hypothetical protein [Sphingomonadaceae bacterium]
MSDPFLDRMDAFDAIQSQRNFSVQHESEVLAAQANVATARPPELAAKANEASRATGIPAGAYDADYLKIFDAQRKQAAIEKVGVKYPKIATFLANPDNAAVAVDDVDNLGVLARTWDEAKRFAIRAPVTMSAGLWGALSATSQTIAKYNPGANLQRAIFGSSIDDALASYANQKSVEGRDIVQANQTRVKNFVGRNLIQGLDSTVTTATGIAAGVLTRNPEATLAIMGAQTGGSEFQKARDAGKGLEQSIFYGAQQGTIEALTEKIPASKLLGDLAAKTPFAKTLFNQLTREIPGEQVATFLQDMTEWANLHPEKTIGEFLQERPQAALETLIQTASGTIVQTSASKAVDASIRVADKVVGKVSAARQAQQESEFLDKLAANAEASKTRTRDPQIYESLVAALSADTGAENAYFPADKVREYLQSSDWDSVEFWQEYDQDIADGTISNGDVVIPIGKAVAHLAGTPAWEALKGDMRLSPGGQSLNEAQETDKNLPDEINRLSDDVSAQMEADRVAAEPRQKLFDTALQKLHEAGQTLSEATKNAMLVANRYATRAARLGREVTGSEFDNVKVQQVLPAGLAPMVAADNLSLVVRAMRRGKTAKDKAGPSLLEWIASKGGIEDRGGDLKAMGADKWHKGKVGQKKLLRTFNRGQMSMLGSDGQQNSNSADELAMRAWEAGYFPEFTERPSVNDLLDAISEGVAGRDRYIPEALQPDETDQMRIAAQDLYQLLDQAGLDPEKASETEIKQAIQRYQEQASRGQGFDQGNGEPPLVVVHNLSAEKFRHADELGGLAAPSLAVVRGDLGFDNFGEITLVGPKDLTDPRNPGVKAFNADVYSPRQPRAQYNINGKVYKSIQADFKPAAEYLGKSIYSSVEAEEISKEGLYAIERTAPAKLTYLRSIGEDVAPIHVAKKDIDPRLLGFEGDSHDLLHNEKWMAALADVFADEIKKVEGRDVAERVRSAYFEEDGSPNYRIARTYANDVEAFNGPDKIDLYAMRKAIDEKIAPRLDAYSAWVADKYGDVLGDKFFVNKSDRRKPYNMDNLVREMTRTIRDGEGYNYGVGSLRSNVAKQFRNITEIKASRGNILPADEFEKIKEGVTDDLFALAEKFSPYHRSSGDFGWMDIFTEFLKDLSHGRLREWQTSIFEDPAPDDLISEARDYLNRLRDLPTEYFEVKMQRPVRFNEFESAIVPKGTPEDVVSRLKKHGLNVIEYDGAGDRTKALQSANKAFFQSAYHGSPHIFDKFSLDKIGTGEGAQAFGWGLYFAGKKEIAEFYRDALTKNKNKNTFKVEAWRRYDDALARFERADKMERTPFQQSEWDMFERADNEKFVAELKAKAESLGERPTDGRLYEVDIPEDGEYLLWDAPLSEQPEKVRVAVKNAFEAMGFDEQGVAYRDKYGVITEGLSEMTGNQFYSWLSEEFVRNETPIDEGNGWTVATPTRRTDDKTASAALRDMGIAGIKYLDGGSRKDGEGSYNYVVFDDNAVSIRAYEQSYSDGPRGRVTFDNGMAVIDLFQQRDLSTFIHEMGHVWLEELQADAALPEAPQQLRDDLQAVFDWFAANGHPVVDGVIPVDAHEMWARGIERYTLEGKAPSSALRRAFDAFRSWMLSIYHLADNLRSPITPEIRGVMDRLIATDEEIQQASEEQNLKALFDSVESAAKFGMNEAAYKDYVKSATEAKDEAFDRLLFKTMETVRRERTKAYRDERDAVAADVRTSVDARPVFRALASLRAVNGLKLNKQWLISTYGEDVLASLPKGVPPIYKDGGVDADMIAEATGFSTGDEMVKALIGVEDRRAALREGGDKRSARDSIIDEETDAIMKERHGDPLSDGSIEEEALALIHNEKQGELQATELRVLSGKTKAETRATPYRIARLWASDKIRNGQVKDVASRAAIQRYLRAASKAGKAAEQAYMAGDTDEAFKQKQAQMLNNALVAEAKQAADAIDIAVARMSRLAKRRTIKSMDQDYLERIHDLLESVDLKERTQASIDRQGSFEEWRAEQEAKGHDIVTPAGFAETIGKTHWSRLTVENLLGLDETVKQIAHLGRYKQELIDNKAKRDFDAVVGEAQASIAKLPPKPPSDLMEPSRWDAVKSRVASMDASLLKMETVFDWLDGGDSNGVFNRIVFRPISDAQDREKAMLTDYTGRLTDLLKAIPKEQLKRWSEKVSLPELLNRETGNPWVMTRDQLVSMALNMGNEGNIQRLVDGYGWNEETVRRVLNRELTAADWQYVQGVWDTIDSLWPEIAAMERRVNGVEPDKVEAVPVVTEHGTLRGGYFPAIYDPRKSIEAEANAAKASDIFENTYTKATTRASSTKERSNKVKRPIHLSLSVINRHVGEVIHDITHREAVMQADKFLSSKRIMTAVDGTMGPEVRKQFRPWLQHIANEWANDRKGVAGWDAFAKKLRTNTSIVGMGFRLSTIVMQVAGYSNSFERVGAKWVAPQLAKAVDPRAYRFVMERSSEVRNRMDTLERDVRENVKQLAGRTDVIANARKFAFYGIGYMDRVVVIPTWLGAYNRGINEGMSEADAGYYADKAVRQSQGAGAAKDLAAVQRSNEWMRLATMFYSYQSAVYQRFRSLGRDVRTAGVRDVPDLIARSFWLIVVPPLLSELLAGRGPDDDEDWGMWSFQKMLAGLFGPIPIARDVVNAAQSGFGYSFTPAARAFETGLNVKTDLGNIFEGDDTKRATRNVLELSGYTLGLPTGQLASSTQFIVDVSEGEQDPQTITDWMEGLSKGKLSDN